MQHNERQAQRAQSQGQQDRVLAQLFAALGTTHRYAVEIGFNSNEYAGGSGANTYALHRAGWRTLLLDGAFGPNAAINLHRAFVTSANAPALLRAKGAPHAPDYVSIDIDSADVWLMQSIARELRPRVISVEYNAHFPAGSRLKNEA